jgi:hypothetical protein
MALENVGGRETFFGALPSRNKFGAEKAGAGSVKELVFEVDYSDLPAVDADNEMLANIPSGAVVTKATFKVTTAFAGGTSYVFGTYQADGGGVVDADGLIVSTATAAIDAVGDYIQGGGALIDATAQTEATSVVIAATGTFTAGEGILTVSYVA